MGAGGGWVRRFLSPGLQGRLGGPGSWLDTKLGGLGRREAKMAQWEPCAVRRGPLVHMERRPFTGDTESGTCDAELGRVVWPCNSMVLAILGPHSVLAMMPHGRYLYTKSPT